MDRILYGAAYYDEYMPYDRLDTDIAMMKKAGINVIRIAESTWSSEEPQEGVFDFSHVTRVLDACEKGRDFRDRGNAHLCRPGLDGEGLPGGDGDGQKRQNGPMAQGRSWTSPIRPTAFSRSASSGS